MKIDTPRFAGRMQAMMPSEYKKIAILGVSLLRWGSFFVEVGCFQAGYVCRKWRNYCD